MKFRARLCSGNAHARCTARSPRPLFTDRHQSRCVSVWKLLLCECRKKPAWKQFTTARRAYHQREASAFSETRENTRHSCLIACVWVSLSLPVCQHLHDQLMASHGSLPLYYKNSKPTGLSSGPGKSWKDNYLLVVVLVAFVILIAGTFWFLPPLDDKDSDYEKTYGRFTGNAASYITDVVVPSEPTLVPPGATRWRVGGGGEGKGREGEGVGIKEPLQRDDRDRDVKEFERNRRPPVSETSRNPETTKSPETSRPPETTKAPETTRPPRTTSPPPRTTSPPPPQSLKEEGQLPDEGAEPVGGASETSVEEKRRKVVEVSV